MSKPSTIANNNNVPATRLKKLNDPGVQRIASSAVCIELKTQSAKQLMCYFKTLQAPIFTDFIGPFKGTLLNSGNSIDNFFNKIVTSNPITGAWQGKQFSVIGADTGFGYNMFGKKNRRLKFGFNTCIAFSQFDDKMSLRMDYVPYPHLLGLVNAYDEIRQIDIDNFLLVAHFTKGILTLAKPIIIHLQRMTCATDKI